MTDNQKRLVGNSFIRLGLALRSIRVESIQASVVISKMIEFLQAERTHIDKVLEDVPD